MNIFAQQDPPLGFVTLAFFAIGACLAAWAVIVERWLSGRPILSYQPRRRVPWQLWDLLAVVVFYIAAFIAVVHFAQYFWPLETNTLSRDTSVGQISTTHPIVQLLAVRDWTAFILCIVVGIAVAPIIEEMFFRVLLQGWLEKTDRDLRRRLPVLRHFMSPGAMPIVLSSLIFAGQHFREATPQEDVQHLMLLFTCNGVTSLFALVFVIVWMRWRVGATAADFGWAPEKLFSDVRLGLLTFVAIAVPIYGVQIILSQLLPKQYAPDPIPIFFFAVALGLLYYRTHRAAPSIAVHMALNASSLAMSLLWGNV